MRVEPSGPVPCDLAIFGERPGYEEAEQGCGFVGKSGRELWSGMQRFCGLTRKDFYISNLVKTYHPKNADPKPQEIAEAMPEFLDELEMVRPAIVITAGAFSTRAMLGGVKLSDVHGIPHTAEIAGRSYTVMPIYHPAAGLHSKGILAAFAYDLCQLGRLRKGELEPWAPSELPARTSWLTRASMRSCEGLAVRRLTGLVKDADVVGLDTEGWAELPWGLSFTADGSAGYVIKASDRAGLSWFKCWLGREGVTLVLQNGIHDIPVLRAMGIDIGPYHDTQVLAYHDMIRTGSGVLEAESQNLGTLAYRECGLRLSELSDIPGVDFDTQTIPYTDEVMHYAGMDPIATWRLFDVYKRRGLVDYAPYQIDMGQVPLVENMIANGIPFDTDATLSYYMDVQEKLATVTESLRASAARLGNYDFNPGSHPQVRALVTKKIGLRIRKRTRGGLASTNVKALADHRGHPFVQSLQDYRELVKLRGTYIVPLLEELSQ